MAAAVAPQIRSMPLLALIDPDEHQKCFRDPAYKASLMEKKELCEETIFWMDINIDGISLFKSSKAPQVGVVLNIFQVSLNETCIIILVRIFILQGIPILCRLYGLGCDPKEKKPTVVIPTDMGYVSMIGMYHGMKKPTLEKFVSPMLVELRQLHPAMPKMVREPDSVDEHGNTRPGRRWKREMCVKVRAMICDAVERPWLRGKHCSLRYCCHFHHTSIIVHD
jgi:hypothetical protein